MRVSAARHIRQETTVGVVINALLSALFFWLVFGPVPIVPVPGIGAFAFDFLPQGFMIGLMATLVPGALTRRKLRAGGIAALHGTTRLPRSLPVRALLVALSTGLIGWGLATAALARLGLAALPWETALIIKIICGGVIGGIITAAGVRATLVHCQQGQAGRLDE
jgi:hypothetical protein